MSNIIDSIQLSGTTYQIQGSGGGGNPTVEVTQAEYDAMEQAGTVQADTYYIITDAQAGDLTNYYTKTETNTLLNGKQATLVSGTNIKTINNESILGSGNIDIQGGGGSITIDPSLDSGSTNPVANSAITNTIYNQTARFNGYASNGYLVSLSSRDSENAIAVEGTKIKTLANATTQSSTSSWLYTSTINGKKAVSSSSSNTKDFSLVETSAITSSITSSSTDAQVPSSKAVYESVSGKVDTSSMSGYVTTDTAQEITGEKTFVGEKKLKFKQSGNSSKIGFTLYNSASTNNELATFEFRPNTYTVDSVQHPLMYIGHYRTTSTANAGVPQTVIGFRQYDQANSAAYHLFAPLPEEAKTPFSLTTSFQNYFIPLGFKNGSTMIKTDNTGVADFSDVLGGLKLVKLTQSEYDNLSTKDSNTLYVIVN